MLDVREVTGSSPVSSTTNPLETIGFGRIFLLFVTFCVFGFSRFGIDHINDHRQKKSALDWGQIECGWLWR